MPIRIVDVPLLKKEWDYEKNTVDINTVSSGSGKQIWWICPKGHSYPATPANRVNAKSGCPYCANKKVLVGFNDLATTRKDLLELWNFKKNTILPTEVTSVSGKKVWWICPKGHEWPATVAHIAYGRRCPVCNSEASSSFPEQAIYYYLNQIDESVQSRFKFNDKYEIDIFIPGKNIGIEYDGYRWHRGKKKKQLDAKKEKYFKDNGLRILRVIEVIKKEELIDGFRVDNDYYYYNNDNIPVLNRIIEKLAYVVFGVTIVVDTEKDRSKIYSNYLLTEKKGSIESDPRLLSLWDFEKNEGVSPSYVKKFSDKTFWWKCPEGHSFPASPHVMSGGLKCPVCEKDSIKKRSLAALYPEIAKEWNYEKNKGVLPEDVLPGSNQDVWWICPKGHDWHSIVVARTREYGRCNCPVCSNRKIIPGVNDLFHLRPELEKEWMYDKNKDIDPKHIGIGCVKKAWWKCSKCGYEWPTQIRLRATLGCGCNVCSSKMAGEKNRENYINNISNITHAVEKRKENSLKQGVLVSSRPDLMAKWDFEKNKGLDPSRFTTGTATKVWWKCDKGHPSFYAAISNVSKGTGCRLCGIEKSAISRRKNDAPVSSRLDIMAKWDFDKNKGVDPNQIALNSTTKVWWKCDKGHPSYLAAVNSVRKGAGRCHECGQEQRAATRRAHGTLVSSRPDLMAKWDFEKNKGLDPDKITTGAATKVWWKCDKGHPSYQTRMCNASKGIGCRLCGIEKRVASRKRTMAMKKELRLSAQNAK